MTLRLLTALVLATTYGTAGTVSGTISHGMFAVTPTQHVYDLALTDDLRSLSMNTQYNWDVAGHAYSPVVFSGFDATCSLSPAPGVEAGPCSWNTSQAYDFEYWTPGRFGDPAPIRLHIETPGASIRYGTTSPTPGYFHFNIDLQFAGGSATLPPVLGVGAISSVNDLPVSFILSIAILSIELPSGTLPGDRWWLTAGQCVWCTSYSGEGLASGTSTLMLFGEPTQSRSYSFTGQGIPEPTTTALVLAGAAILWVKWRTRTK